MTHKRQNTRKVKGKLDESSSKQSMFVECILLQKKHLSFAGASVEMLNAKNVKMCGVGGYHLLVVSI